MDICGYMGFRVEGLWCLGIVCFCLLAYVVLGERIISGLTRILVLVSIY